GGLARRQGAPRPGLPGPSGPRRRPPYSPHPSAVGRGAGPTGPEGGARRSWTDRGRSASRPRRDPASAASCGARQFGGKRGRVRHHVLGDPTDHVDARDLGRIERNVRPNERTEVTVQDLHVGGLLVVLVRQILARALLEDRKSTRLNSSHGSSSYAVFCL